MWASGPVADIRNAKRQVEMGNNLSLIGSPRPIERLRRLVAETGSLVLQKFAEMGEAIV